MASNREHKVTFAQEGGLRAMISLAREDDLTLQILAIGTLRHLSLSSRVKKPMIEEGALGPIFERVETSDDLDLLQQCAGVLANCSENGQNQVSMIKDGVFLLKVIIRGS